MLQKMQWTVAATALVIGASLVTTAGPAQAQVRYHLMRGGMKTIVGTGIVIPPPASNTPPTSGIVIPSNTIPTPPPAPVVPPPAPVVTPPPAPVTPPPPPPVVNNNLSQGGFFGGYFGPAPTPQTSPQGFSAGPTLLGDQRLPLGHMVDRIPPSIIGDSGPTVQKVTAHH